MFIANWLLVFVRLRKAVYVIDVSLNRVRAGGNGVCPSLVPMVTDAPAARGTLTPPHVLKTPSTKYPTPMATPEGVAAVPGFSLGCVLDQIVLAAPAGALIDPPPDDSLGGTGDNGTKCILRLSAKKCAAGVPRTFMLAVACTLSPITNLLVVGGGRGEVPRPAQRTLTWQQIVVAFPS